MKEVGRVEITFLKDRGFNKVRVNLIREDQVIGFMRQI